jgi:predicted permease
MNLPFEQVGIALLEIVGWACGGMLLRHWKLLKQEWEGTLLKCVIWFFYPCLIIRNVMVNQALSEQPAVLGSILGCGFCAIALGQVLSFFVARGMQFEKLGERNTFVFTTGIFNYGYFAFPVSRALFGEEAFGVLLVFAVGVEMAIWSVGILFLTAGTGKLNWKKLLNPPLFSMAIALTLNWSGAAESISGEGMAVLEKVGWIAIPMGLMLIGAAMYDHLHELNLKKYIKWVGMACLLRLGILPALYIVAAAMLPIIPELKAALVVEAAMPCGIFPMLIARHYGGSGNTALQLILGTTFLSVITIPLWVLAGVHFTGLEEMLINTE